MHCDSFTAALCKKQSSPLRVADDKFKRKTIESTILPPFARGAIPTMISSTDIQGEPHGEHNSPILPHTNKQVVA